MGDINKEKVYPRLSNFFVDLFGALIPGIIFTVFVLLVIINCSLILILVIDNNFLHLNEDKLSIINFTSFHSISNYLYLGLFILFLVSSYIFGYIFLRFGHRKPDQKSFIRIVKKYHSLPSWANIKDSDRLIRRDKIIAIREAAKKLNWPYSFLKIYLGNQVPHLAKMVDWDEENLPSRTKINAIKGAIQFYFPDKYAQIAQNEAQVRLSSSVWFISNIMLWLSIFITIILIIFIFTIYFKKLFIYNKIYYIMSLILYIIVIILSAFIKIAIEKTFHYLRVREITFILNTAYQARKRDNKFGQEFWDKDLNPLKETSDGPLTVTRHQRQSPPGEG